MVKIKILTKCERCDGQAYVPIGVATDYLGNQYLKHEACPKCQGTGMISKWISLDEFLTLLDRAKCLHENVVTQGGFHYEGGETWDDVMQICTDCGEVLR